MNAGEYVIASVEVDLAAAVTLPYQLSTAPHPPTAAPPLPSLHFTNLSTASTASLLWPDYWRDLCVPPRPRALTGLCKWGRVGCGTTGLTCPRLLPPSHPNCSASPRKGPAHRFNITPDFVQCHVYFGQVFWIFNSSGDGNAFLGFKAQRKVKFFANDNFP